VSSAVKLGLNIQSEVPMAGPNVHEIDGPKYVQFIHEPEPIEGRVQHEAPPELQPGPETVS
jgi:hypothetical protein